MVYKLNGRVVSREEFFEEKKGIGDILESGIMMSQSTGYPYYSTAMGVNPLQIDEAVKALKKAGFRNPEFNELGDLKVESRGHKRRLCRHFGLFDRDAGYGDASPLNG